MLNATTQHLVCKADRLFKYQGVGYAWSMRIILFLSLLFVLLPCPAKEIYRSVSEDGVVSYSDTYSPGSERISVSTKAAADSKKSEKSVESGIFDEKDGRTLSTYQNFAVAKPEHDESINSNEGNVLVGLSLSPALAEGHAIQVYLDGAKLEDDVMTTQFALNGLNRGTHSLQAKIVDRNGKLLKSTKMINFHLHKASIYTP